MPLNLGQYKTSNYMVPSNGQTHAVVLQGQFSNVPYLMDWRQFAIDNEKIQPQGAFIDNTAGTVPLVITVLPINYPVVCPAGMTLQAQFPAPNGQTMQITGDPANTATIIFVDFPVLPSSTQAQVTNTVNTNIESVNPAVVIRVDPNPMAAGNTLPYRDQEYVPVAEYHALAITGAALTANVVPAIPNQNLRKLRVYVTGDAAMAAAGLNTLTVTLNGAQIFTRKFYLPAAAPATPGLGFTLCDLDADNIGLAAAAGNLTVTIATALSVGQLDVDSYFTPQ